MRNITNNGMGYIMKARVLCILNMIHALLGIIRTNSDYYFEIPLSYHIKSEYKPADF